MYIGSLRSGRWSTADRSFAIRICLVLCDGAKPVLTGWSWEWSLPSVELTPFAACGKNLGVAPWMSSRFRRWLMIAVS
jgi:hypothetical protein